MAGTLGILAVISGIDRLCPVPNSAAHIRKDVVAWLRRKLPPTDFDAARESTSRRRSSPGASFSEFAKPDHPTHPTSHTRQDLAATANTIPASHILRLRVPARQPESPSPHLCLNPGTTYLVIPPSSSSDVSNPARHEPSTTSRISHDPASIMTGPTPD
jgi:hypothetical protein